MGQFDGEGELRSGVGRGILERYGALNPYRKSST